MLGIHRGNGISVAIIGYAQLLVALLYWRPGRGPGWPVPLALGLSAAETLQIYLGFNRIIGVHVPLGVTIIATAALLTASVWRPTFDRPKVS
jgi:hypothetical protein